MSVRVIGHGETQSQSREAAIESVGGAVTGTLPEAVSGRSQAEKAGLRQRVWRQLRLSGGWRW
jgi:hypothetical protein